tara:strand:+ start:38222 stop:38959 length:738 start_codon:yes stop_codon:yes gene_type:complete
VKVFIKVKPPAGDVKYYPISNEPITLGRTKASKISVDDGELSGLHLRLYIQGKSLFVEDLESKNGTSLNDIKIYQQRFCTGDQLKAGSTVIEIAGKEKNSEDILNLLKRNSTGITLNLQTKEETRKQFGNNEAAQKFTRSARLYHGEKKQIKKKSESASGHLKEAVALVIDIGLGIAVFSFLLKIAPRFYPEPFANNSNKAISFYFSVDLLPVTIVCLAAALIVYKINRGNGEKPSLGEKLVRLD